jgi:hypothetical protein
MNVYVGYFSWLYLPIKFYNLAITLAYARVVEVVAEVCVSSIPLCSLPADRFWVGEKTVSNTGTIPIWV